MNNHRKSQEAPSERPAGVDPNPGEDGMGNTLSGYLKFASEAIRQWAKDEIDSEMRKWGALPLLVHGWSLDENQCVQESKIAALFDDIDGMLGQSPNKGKQWRQVFNQYPHAIETVYETAKDTGLTARDLSQIPVTRWYYLTPHAVILMNGAKEPRTEQTKEES